MRVSPARWRSKLRSAPLVEDYALIAKKKLEDYLLVSSIRGYIEHFMRPEHIDGSSLCGANNQ